MERVKQRQSALLAQKEKCHERAATLFALHTHLARIQFDAERDEELEFRVQKHVVRRADLILHENENLLIRHVQIQKDGGRLQHWLSHIEAGNVAQKGGLGEGRRQVEHAPRVAATHGGEREIGRVVRILNDGRRVQVGQKLAQHGA
jgi:hypothetical protein